MAETTLKLGKKPVVYDRRTLQLENYLIGALPANPPSRAWDAGVISWGDMLNRTLGCCVISAMGHAEQVVTANTLGVAGMITVPDSAVLAGYEQVGGYVPGNPATDGGCVMLNGLKWWQQNGIGGHTIAAYAACSITQPMIEACINLFGFCYVGLAIPFSAMAQFNAGQPWTVVANDGGIDGGHCVVLVDYDQDGPTAITWGQRQKMSWQFFFKYCSPSNGEGEAYGVITHEWLAANGQSPSQLDWNALQRDLALVSGQPDPGDPTTVAFYQWWKADAAYAAGQYPVAPPAALAQVRQMVATGQAWDAYLAGQSSTAPALPRIPA